MATEIAPALSPLQPNTGSDARMAMILHYVAIGSLITMSGIAAAQMMRDIFWTPARERGQLS
jgi:hypothetical protein